MGEHAQKRIIRKLDLELFLSQIAPQPTPQAQLEQYTISESVAATILYIAAYSNDSIVGKTVLDLGCGTGRLALGAAYLGAESVVGVDVDMLAIKTAVENSRNVGLTGASNGSMATSMPSAASLIPLCRIPLLECRHVRLTGLFW